MRSQDAGGILSEKYSEGHKNSEKLDENQNLTEKVENVTEASQIALKNVTSTEINDESSTATPGDQNFTSFSTISAIKARNPEGLTEAGKAYMILVLFAVVFIIMSIAIYVKHRQTRAEDDLLLGRNSIWVIEGIILMIHGMISTNYVKNWWLHNIFLSLVTDFYAAVFL